MRLFILLFSVLCLSNLGQAQPPSYSWAKSVGGGGSEFGNSLCNDSKGNIYACGYYQSPSVTFGTTVLTGSSGRNIFVAKYDSLGNVVWANSANTTGADCEKIYYDSRGYLFVTGYFSGSSISFGTITLSNPNPNFRDIFIVKYDTLGNIVWAKSFGGVTDDLSKGITTDSHGFIYVTGFFNSPVLSFGASTLSNSGSNDFFVAKFDSVGNPIWAKSAIGAGIDGGEKLVTDTNGNTYVTGYFKSDSLILDNITLTNSGNFDMFVSKYDSSGNIVWAKSAGGINSDFGNAISIQNQYIYVYGLFSSPNINFNSTTLFVDGFSDAFIVKYDLFGNIIWADDVGGTGAEYNGGITSDQNGNIYLSGYFDSPYLAFGSDTLYDLGVDDIFILKYDSLGNKAWAKSINGISSEQCYDISSDPSGVLFVCGGFYSPTISLGGNSLTNNGQWDFFITRLSNSTTTLIDNFSICPFKVYPNPSTSQITIELTKDSQIFIENTFGQIVTSISLNKGSNNIDLRSLPNGIYFLTVKTELEVGTINISKVD